MDFIGNKSEIESSASNVDLIFI